ncbi:MAG: 4-diphosphocytidyl-2-methyl-D-erithritol synthase [Verrucomicrobiota bacterium]|jgi:2-C-methyl-D-erythritol 4-phosphate cytidylyltransferase
MNTAVIVAAGRGTRMGPGIDKLFLEVAGLPVVAHTWRRFDAHPLVDHVCLVIRPGLEPEFEQMARQLGIRKPHSLVPGGSERQDSVWNGLSAVPPGTELVAIQDGARPCTSAETITRCLQAARASGAAVASQRAVDTIKESDGANRVARHLDRARLWTVQTPQCFRLPVILGALAEARKQGVVVTDDTAACGWVGAPVELVECPDPNPKVTVPADLRLVALWL